MICFRVLLQPFGICLTLYWSTCAARISRTELPTGRNADIHLVSLALFITRSPWIFKQIVQLHGKGGAAFDKITSAY
jgi:hypothetical protein